MPVILTACSIKIQLIRRYGIFYQPAIAQKFGLLPTAVSLKETRITKKDFFRSSGLHTQHVHDLYAPDSNLHMAYPTHDNDAWYRSTPGVFTSENILGDATWVGGDAGNPTAAILVLQVGVCGKCSLLTGFGNNLPSGTPFQKITLCNDITYDGNKTALLKFIQ